MTISACIIMKNEQDNVLKMINSIRHFVDEIIVVDTGSTDLSITLVEQQGIVVHPFNWTDNFSEARNYSISLATSEWIFWIDCDEELIIPEYYNIKQFLSDVNLSLGKCSVINLVTDEGSEESKYIIPQFRLFRRSDNYMFINSIHEHLNIERQQIKTKSFNCEWIIKHSGYTPAIVEQKNKSARNIQMIETAIKRGDENPWLIYHLASENYRLKQFNEAFLLINFSIKNFIDRNEYPPSLLYKMKYDILMSAGQYEGLIKAIPLALQLYPTYIDLHFYQAVAYYEMKEYEKAIPIFQTCLTIDDSQTDYLTLEGINSFRSYYYLSLCYEFIGDKENELLYKEKYILSKSK